MGGNLCTASPIGDSAPVLLAYDATIELRSSTGTRTVPIGDFFKGYRQIDIQAGEVPLSGRHPTARSRLACSGIQGF